MARSTFAKARPRTANRTTSKRGGRPSAGRLGRPVRAARKPRRSAPRQAARTGAARIDPMDRPVHELLERLSQALTAGDGDGAAACFTYPAMMVMGSGVQPLADPATVAGFFGAAPTQYHDKGIYDTQADVERVEWLTPDLALAHTHWPYLDAEGEPMGDGESSVYVLRRNVQGDLAVCTAVALGIDSERQAGVEGRALAARRRGGVAPAPLA